MHLNKINIEKLNDLQYFEQFELLKTFYDMKNNIRPQPPVFCKPYTDDETTTMSSDLMENRVFIFSINNYYCLNKTDKEDDISWENINRNERKKVSINRKFIRHIQEDMAQVYH